MLDPMRRAVALEDLRTQCAGELAFALDRARRCLWVRFESAHLPCFTPAALRAIEALQCALEDSGGHVRAIGREAVALRFVVVSSAHPAVFNLGGDLEHFGAMIRAGDYGALIDYGLRCARVIARHWNGYGCGLYTISLVRGLALGGGAECALSSHEVIAERGARLGFPEIKFGLFPGMGAVQLLGARVPAGLADRLILAGEIHAAAEMAALDVLTLADDGAGRQAVESLIDGLQAPETLAALVQAVRPITQAEIEASIRAWVDAAMVMSPRNLGLLLRIRAEQVRAMMGAADGGAARSA